MSTQARLFDVELRIKILDAVIREARENGDERWVEPARQAAILNEERGMLMKLLRQERGEHEPDAVSVQVKQGLLKGQTHG